MNISEEFGNFLYFVKWIILQITIRLKRTMEKYDILQDKKHQVRIYDLDYYYKDPIVKTAVRNRKRRKIKWGDEVEESSLIM